MTNVIRRDRLDERDQYFLDNELQKFDPTKYYELVTSTKGRKYLPPVGGVGEYDPSYKYAMVHLKGRAKVMGAGANDAPSVKATKTEHLQAIKPIESTIEYTFDEIGAARQRGIDLENDSTAAAVVGTEEQVDNMLAFGDEAASIPGLLNNAAVLSTNATDKGGGVTSWLNVAASGTEILKDISLLLGDVRGTLKDARQPGMNTPTFERFTLLLPPDHLTFIATTPRSDTSDTTILEFILEKMRRWIVAVDDWSALAEADAGNPMGMLFPAMEGGAMHPLCGGALLPLDFKREAEQYVGRKVVIPTVAKCGGAVNRYPVGCRYLKLI